MIFSNHYKMTNISILLCYFSERDESQSVHSENTIYSNLPALKPSQLIIQQNKKKRKKNSNGEEIEVLQEAKRNKREELQSEYFEEKNKILRDQVYKIMAF